MVSDFGYSILSVSNRHEYEIYDFEDLYLDLEFVIQEFVVSFVIYLDLKIIDYQISQNI